MRRLTFLVAWLSVLALSARESKPNAKMAEEQTKLHSLRLKKLAQVFAVDVDALREEVELLRPIARTILLDTRCTNKDAWRDALRKAHRRVAKAGAGANFEALRAVLVRHACFCASTSGVEQTFSKFDRLFGNQRLASHNDTEVNIMKLIIDTPDAEESDIVVQRARETWARHFGLARHHAEPRIDKGCERASSKAVTGNSVMSISRKRLREVQNLMEEFADCDISEKDIAELRGWSGSHAMELEFQQSKRRKIKVEALKDGHLIDEEMDMEVQADAAEREKMIR